jgi:hypothetical protein
MIKAGQQRRFEMESTQEEKLNSVDVSHLPSSEILPVREITRLFFQTLETSVRGPSVSKGKPSRMRARRDRM